jgi:hypothetical protein
MCSIQSNAEEITTDWPSYDENGGRWANNNVIETNVSEEKICKEVKNEEEQESKKIKFVVKKLKKTKKMINDDVNKEEEENKIIERKKKMKKEKKIDCMCRK